GVDAQCPRLAALGLDHQPGPADLQYAAHLSPGWRPDTALLALVLAWTRAQSPGGHDGGLCRRCRAHPAGLVDALRLGWLYLRLHPDELLVWTSPGASVV